jgi:hypothetical protein
VLEDIRKNEETVQTEKRKNEAQFDPTTIQGQAAIAKAKKTAELAAQEDYFAQNSDARNAYLCDEIHSGRIDLAHAITGRDAGARKDSFFAYLSDHGLMLPTPHSPQAQHIMQDTQPVKERVDIAIDAITKEIQAHPEAKNQPGYFFNDRFQYALGVNPTAGGLVTRAAMDNIVGAGRILKGSSRAAEQLDKAEIHLPQMWKDSPSLILEKLKAVREQLTLIQKSALDFGNKYGVDNPEEDNRTLKSLQDLQGNAASKPSKAAGSVVNVVRGPNGQLMIQR